MSLLGCIQGLYVLWTSAFLEFKYLLKGTNQSEEYRCGGGMFCNRICCYCNRAGFESLCWDLRGFRN